MRKLDSEYVRTIKVSAQRGGWDIIDPTVFVAYLGGNWKDKKYVRLEQKILIYLQALSTEWGALG